MNDIKKYIDNKISVLPIRKGLKSPQIKSWTEYMHYRMGWDEFSLHLECSVAMIGGTVSGNLECLDFDNHFGDADAIYNKFCNTPEVLEILAKHNIPSQKTQSGGYHIIYRCEGVVSGSKKLASRAKENGKADALIETRGEGGYFLVYPSAGYSVISGDLTEDIPTISVDERKVLISYSKSANEFLGTTKVVEKFETVRAGDDYNAKTTEAEMASMLRTAGWSSSNDIHWVRPDKKAGTGISATLGKAAPKMFFAFSSNADPFEASQGYYPFEMKTLLEYNGIHDNCLKDLSAAGFGEFVPDATKRKNYVEPEVGEKPAKKTKLEKMRDWDDYVCDNLAFNRNVILGTLEMRLSSDVDAPWELINEDKIYNIAVNMGSTLSRQDILSRVFSEHIKEHDPFKDYFSGLPKWDGEDRLSKWAKSVTVQDEDRQEYSETMLKKSLARQYLCSISPLVNREVIVLISKRQKNGKTWFCQWITPMRRQDYTDSDAWNSGYSTVTEIKADKDVKIATAQNFTFIIDETDKLGKMAMSAVKSLISDPTVNERFPYEKQPRLMMRRCTFWGTSNEDSFLDRDANKRWIPIYVKNIDYNYSKIDKVQMWSQIVHEVNVKGKDAYEISEEEELVHAAENEKVVVDSDEMDAVRDIFEKSDDKFLSNRDIRRYIDEEVSSGIKLSTRGISKAFGELEFKAGRTKGTRGFYCKKRLI
jgi:hypothetical protein